MKFYKSRIVRFLALGSKFPPGFAPHQIEETVKFLDDRVEELFQWKQEHCNHRWTTGMIGGEFCKKCDFHPATPL